MTENWLHSLATPWDEKRVTVLGAGVSGTAAARLLVALSAKVFVSDQKPLARELSSLPIEYEVGHSDRLFAADLIVVSPGVRAEVWLDKATCPVIAELELGWAILSSIARERQSAFATTAVTGTNGKTTTTALIGHLLRESQRAVFVGGNIGKALSDLPRALLEGQEELPGHVVVEVSSYQAETLQRFAADVAVYLNLTPDHLDRYGTMAAYAAAKARLFVLQKSDALAVLNADDPVASSVQTAARRECFSTEGSADAFLVDAEHGRCDAIYDLGAGRLFGKHNRQNQLAAILVARAHGLSFEQIQQGLNSFAGVEHRLEWVTTVGGVRYFNDSKGTNDAAAAKALSAVPPPIVWLAGGRDKQGGYAECVAAGQGNVRAAILFGEAAPLIESAVGSRFPSQRVANLTEAVALSAKLAAPGDSVLLSPACSSFDQFKNYEERGRTFKSLVAGLQQ